MTTNHEKKPDIEKSSDISINKELPLIPDPKTSVPNSTFRNNQLRTIYNSLDFSDFSKENLDYEKKLYQEELKKYRGSQKSFLKTLPLDHPLIVIIDGKRIKLLYQWEKMMIPVGGNKKDDLTIIDDFKKLRNKDVSEVLRFSSDGKWEVLWDYTPYDSGLNQYFPEMLDVDTVNGSVVDCLRYLERFLYGYETKILNNPRVEITEKNIYNKFKQMCRISTGTQSVGNFPVMVGMYIIQKSYFKTIEDFKGVPNDHFVVLDVCSGWGSRLLGTLCVFNRLRVDYYNRFRKQLHITYLSTDPNKLVDDRFKNIVLDWFQFIEPEDTSEYFHLEKETMGCETPEFLDYCKSVLSSIGLSGVNVSFTSPPYFNREKYSKDKGQSYLRYPTYPEWRDKFLSGMINNVHELLSPGSRFYLNISNTLETDGKVNPLEIDSCRFLEELGMCSIMSYKMVLSGSSDSEHKVSVGVVPHKFEPVFVYEKSK